MARDNNTVADGTFAWYGGMDMSRPAYAINKDQYVKGVNVAISEVGSNLQPRPGWHWQTIKFGSPLEQDRFETGHIQGGDWFFDGQRTSLVISVSGVLYFLQEERPGYWKARTLNLGNPNNPSRTKVWTCRIPGNRLIVSDGQSLPWVIGLNGSVERTDPDKMQLGVCRMMAYVQNRLWWVDETGKFIYGSDIQDPLSIQEALDTNIFGFVPPDEREGITAIGQQRYINFDQNGGELVFSALNNVYAVDVRGPREDWGASGRNGTGFVRLVVPFVGAVSAYSFTNYNANLFYRTQSLGVANYKQLQTQFANNDELISNSVEVDHWYRNDTEWMLDQCYTVNYKNRLLTTTQPALKNGYVYWKGLISMNPAPYYGSTGRLPRRFEGLWTGVQPWCLIHQRDTVESLFCVSLDGDDRNRLYRLADTDRYDIAPGDIRRPIQGIVETRAYAYDAIEAMKIATDRYYTLDEIRSNVSLKAYSRSTLKGRWFHFADVEHYLPKCCPTSCFPFYPVDPEPRLERRLTGEKETGCFFVAPGGKMAVPYRSYRLEFTGDYELSRFATLATIQPDNQTTPKPEEDNRFATDPVCRLTDFGYLIVPKLEVPPELTNARNNSNTSSGCACSS